MSTMIKDTAVISKEVLSGEVFGSVKIYNLDDPSKVESSARRMLGMTYPTQALQQAMMAIEERMAGKRRQGAFVFAGDYGTGKSHSLLALYHLLTSPDEGQRWLDRGGLSFGFPPGVQAAVSHLLIEDPDFAWEPIFSRLGRDDLLAEVRDHPTGEQIRQLASDESLVIILDELESWFGPIKDVSRRERNLNFLQNLTEMAQDPGLKLIVLGAATSSCWGVWAARGCSSKTLEPRRTRPKWCCFVCSRRLIGTRPGARLTTTWRLTPPWATR